MLAQATQIGTTFFNGTGNAATVFAGTGLSGMRLLVSLFLKFALVTASVILLFFFVMGGLGMISSAGKNDPQKAAQAKQTLTTAVLGFVIVFAAYWIVNLIGQLLFKTPNFI